MKRCAYCGGELQAILPGRRAWKKDILRFCCKAHKKAYEHAQIEEHRAKNKWVEFLTRGGPPA
jgi:hypothetical protein